MSSRMEVIVSFLSLPYIVWIQEEGRKLNFPKPSPETCSFHFYPHEFCIYLVFPCPELWNFIALFPCLEKWKQTGVIKGRIDVVPDGLAWILSSAVRATLHCTLLCQHLTWSLAHWSQQGNPVHLLLAPFGSKIGNKETEKQPHLSGSSLQEDNVKISRTYAETMSFPKAARGKNQNSWKARSLEGLTAELEIGPRGWNFLCVFLCWEIL